MMEVTDEKRYIYFKPETINKHFGLEYFFRAIASEILEDNEENQITSLSFKVLECFFLINERKCLLNPKILFVLSGQNGI